jgi:uncharacterized RmlC-like cupin family protein
MNNTIVFAVRDRIERIMAMKIPFCVIVTSKRDCNEQKGFRKMAGMAGKLISATPVRKTFVTFPMDSPRPSR